MVKENLKRHKIVINKYSEVDSAITENIFSGYGEIALSIEEGKEGIYIKNKNDKKIKLSLNEKELDNLLKKFENLERLVDNSSPNQDLTKTEYKKLLAENEIIIYRNGIEKKIFYNDSVYYMIYEDDVKFEAPDFSQTAVTLVEDYQPYNPIVITSGVNVNLNEKTIIGPIFKENYGNVEEGDSDSYGFWVKEGGELTIEGNGKVVAQDAKYSMAVWNNGGKVYIKNGTFINSGDSCDLIYTSKGNIYISGGTFIATSKGSEPGTGNEYSALNIKDTSTNEASILVCGGSFYKFDPANNSSEDSKEWWDNHPHGFLAEGFYSILEDDYYNVYPYPNLSSSAITLENNFAPFEPISFEDNEIRTLDLNGKKITSPVFVDESDNSTNSYGIWVKSGELTIKGDGEIKAQDADYSMAVWANGGKVIISGGTFINSGDSCDLIYASNNGHVVIYDGVFKATPKDKEPGTGNKYSALNIKDSDRGNSSITVYGGKFYGFNPADNSSEDSSEWWDNHPHGFLADGYESVKVEENGEVWWKVKSINDNE